MKPGFSTKIRQEALPQRPATGLPCSGRLLHEPRAVLAGDCAYCTNPRTPRSTPTPRPVGPDPRALRPGEVRTPRERPRPSTNKPSAAELLPRVRVGGIWRRSCRPTPDTATHWWRPDARWRRRWLEAGQPSRGRTSSSAASWCGSGGEASSSWWPTTSTTG